MDIELISPTHVRVAGKEYRCAIGKKGISKAKREGDNCTPTGTYYLRELFWRPDKFASAPSTLLKSTALKPDMGWCDEPNAFEYNQPVMLPFAQSHEKLWREDGIYDLIVPLGYNDAPVVPGLGSAIFLHIARGDYSGTEGCIALAREDLIEVLQLVGPDSRMIIPDELEVLR